MDILFFFFPSRLKISPFRASTLLVVSPLLADGNVLYSKTPFSFVFLLTENNAVKMGNSLVVSLSLGLFCRCRFCSSNRLIDRPTNGPTGSLVRHDAVDSRLTAALNNLSATFFLFFFVFHPPLLHASVRRALVVPLGFRRFLVYYTPCPALRVLQSSDVS